MFRKIVYCSPIVGEIHWAGKPLSGLKVTRYLRSGGFDNGVNQDHAHTDVHGKFRFETLAERRLFRPDLLSANPHVSQLVYVTHEGIDYTIWGYQKQDFDLGTESQNGELKITCDLSAFQEDSVGRFVRCKHNGVQQP